MAEALTGDAERRRACGALTVGSAFSGIGGIDLGLQRAGMEIRWQIEIDDWCRRVLAKHWPDVARYGDIRELTGDDLEPVDVIAGGFPCQPVSLAGKRLGQDDDRWLWPDLMRLVRVVRPRYVLLENVPGLLSRGMSDVLRDLAACGYDAEWDCIPAAAVGAPHLRDRIWIVAYPNSSRSTERGQRQDVPIEGAGWRDERVGSLCVARQVGMGSTRQGAGDHPDAGRSGLDRGARPHIFATTRVEAPRRHHANGLALAERTAWASEPAVCRVLDGLPTELDRARLRGLGNAVVPAVVELIGRRILEAAS